MARRLLLSELMITANKIGPKWWTVVAGVTVAAAVWTWRHLFPDRRTPQERRAAEKARQREVRRGLRGLTKESV